MYDADEGKGAAAAGRSLLGLFASSDGRRGAGELLGLRKSVAMAVGSARDALESPTGSYGLRASADAGGAPGCPPTRRVPDLASAGQGRQTPR